MVFWHERTDGTGRDAPAKKIKAVLSVGKAKRAICVHGAYDALPLHSFSDLLLCLSGRLGPSPNCLRCGKEEWIYEYARNLLRIPINVSQTHAKTELYEEAPDRCLPAEL